MKLIGRTDMEDALKRLDKLTQEEARMAIAQNLKATHAVDERVRGVANTVVAIDNRVAGVDDRVAGVDDRVARVNDRVAGVDNKVARVDDNVKGVDARVATIDDRVKVVDDKVDEVIHGTQMIFSQAREMFNLGRSDGKEAKQVIEQTANDVDQMKRSSSPNPISSDYQALYIISEEQLREKIHRWLSPPDPSTNHNIVCETHHKKAATWFFQGSMFRNWKSTASLLWINGKRAPYSPFLTQYPLMIS
jgi:archaellum component FlaC